MNIPAAYRTVIYWVVLVCTVLVGVLSGLGLVPQDALTKGGETVVFMITIFAQIMALMNIKPDVPLPENYEGTDA
jgi:hypothetical protein